MAMNITQSQEAHQIPPVAYAGNAAAQERLTSIEAEIDVLIAQLWRLTDEELVEIRAGLQELRE